MVHGDRRGRSFWQKPSANLLVGRNTFIPVCRFRLLNSYRKADNQTEVKLSLFFLRGTS